MVPSTGKDSWKAKINVLFPPCGHPTFDVTPLVFHMGVLVLSVFIERHTSDSLWCSSAPGMSGTLACGRRQRWSCSIPSEGWSQCWSESLRRPGWLSFSPRHKTTGSTAPLQRHGHANIQLRQLSRAVRLTPERHHQLGFLIAARLLVHQWREHMLRHNGT